MYFIWLWCLLGNIQLQMNSRILPLLGSGYISFLQSPFVVFASSFILRSANKAKRNYAIHMMAKPLRASLFSPYIRHLHKQLEMWSLLQTFHYLIYFRFCDAQTELILFGRHQSLLPDASRCCFQSLLPLWQTSHTL